MSNYVKATNFTAKDSLPSGNAGKIVKGTEIDVELTAVASAIASKADSNSPSFTGTPLAPTNSTATTSNTQIATTAFVQNAVAAYIPSGVIVLWSGSIASIPTGWYLCNGSNGTPDLRDRFIVGAGSTYTVAGTGGSANAIVVEHTHSPGTLATSSSGAHQHYAVAYDGTTNRPGLTSSNYVKERALDGSSDDEYVLNGTNTVANVGLTSSNGAHTHTFSGTTASTGSSATNANLPPYYALAYIMKA
jgi:hypothetical protein